VLIFELVAGLFDCEMLTALEPTDGDSKKPVLIIGLERALFDFETLRVLGVVMVEEWE
jgi:hypothetical protein